LLDWELLSAVLVADVPPDVMVVAKGKLLPFPAPRSLDELRAYLRMGIGLCVRHTERCHRAFRGIADAFADLGDAQVQLFVTPGGTHGFGWHYDDEDVFIAQTEGIKDYYFRANTVAADQCAHAAAFHQVGDESSTLCTATLVAGDFLYLPARWWHMAVCQQTSLSISVGVTTRPAT
jgi:ribosomal protein L16 Arg81 hydroxylase